MNQGEIVAVIPARGGSKGIARKNLKLLKGEPLIARAVRSALEASRLNRIIVTTDDDEIAAAAAAPGVEVLMRPAELAADDTPMVPVLNHVLDHLAETSVAVEAIALLDVTSPFRRGPHIDACIEKLTADVETVVTVTQLERNPYNIFKVDGDRAERFIEKPEGHFQSRHELTHLKRINGCVYITRAANIVKGRIIVSPVRVVEMRPEESVNIDTPLDLAIAEWCADLFDKEKTDKNQ